MNVSYMQILSVCVERNTGEQTEIDGETKVGNHCSLLDSSYALFSQIRVKVKVKVRVRFRIPMQLTAVDGRLCNESIRLRRGTRQRPVRQRQ